MYQLLWGDTAMVLPLFHIDILDTQGACPLLRVTVAKKDYTLQKAGATVHLMKGDQVLFRGTLRAPLSAGHGDFILLVFDCGQTDRTDQCARALAPFQDRNTVDLLYPEHVREDPFHALNWVDRIPAIDRVSGDVKIKTLDAKMEPMHDIQDQFLKTDFHIKHHEPRYEGGRMNVKVEWMQRYDGVAAFGPLLGPLDTLTPDVLHHNWWRPTNTLLKRGYRLLKSKLIPDASGPKTVDVQGKALSLFRLIPTLTMNWHYRQKRVETVGWTWGDPQKQRLVIPIHLQDITTPVRLAHWMPHHKYREGCRLLHKDSVYQCHKTHTSGSLFNDDLWQRLTAHPHALDVAHGWSFFKTKAGTSLLKALVTMGTLLNRGMGSFLEVQVTVPFEKGLPVRPFHSVKLKDERLPGGKGCGVVHSVCHVIEGDAQMAYTKITLRMRDTCSQFVMKGLQVKTAAQGILNPHHLTPGDLITEMKVSNKASAQMAQLMSMKAPSLQALKRYGTRVLIRLKPLTHRPPLHHGWDLDVVTEKST